MSDPEARQAYDRWALGLCPCCGRRAAGDPCLVCHSNPVKLATGLEICGHCAALGHADEVQGVDVAAYLAEGISRGRQLGAGVVER